MPWQEVSIVDQRREFVQLAMQEGANRRELCRRVTATVLDCTGVDCTPGMRHDNFCDSAVAMTALTSIRPAKNATGTLRPWTQSSSTSTAR